VLLKKKKKKKKKKLFVSPTMTNTAEDLNKYSWFVQNATRVDAEVSLFKFTRNCPFRHIAASFPRAAAAKCARLCDVATFHAHNLFE
jgi:hypothetical protein